jgi:hypothetical protein
MKRKCWPNSFTDWAASFVAYFVAWVNQQFMTMFMILWISVNRSHDHSVNKTTMSMCALYTRDWVNLTFGLELMRLNVHGHLLSRLSSTRRIVRFNREQILTQPSSPMLFATAQMISCAKWLRKTYVSTDCERNAATASYSLGAIHGEVCSFWEIC